MPTITTCPSCNGALRLPDELAGRRVRCPTCQTVFDATASPGAPPSAPVPAAPEPERPLWKDLRLDLDKSDPDSPQIPPAAEPPPAPARTPRLIGAVEVKPTGDDGSAPSPPPRPPDPLFGSEDGEIPTENDEDYPRRTRYGPRRRDTAPHRGVLILVLGIVSLAFTVFILCDGLGILVGLPLGIVAWVLGNGDLRKIKNQEMDEEGLGMTQAGWICGIIGTILHSLGLLSCGAFLAFFIIMQANSTKFTPKPQFGAPPPPPPPAMKR